MMSEKIEQQKKSPHILIVGATHGHEYLGVRVIETLKGLRVAHGTVEYVIGNTYTEE